ncbi:MAG: NADH-quinone oxidoreductase subunit L [Acidobacteria bacterium]|nr:NADH-quinone oxidoreductase subunit L [Acidobacteriota bacterium]
MDIMNILQPSNLLCPLILPAIVGFIILLIPKKVKYVSEFFALATTAYMLYVGFTLFGIKDAAVSYPWVKVGPLALNLDLVINQFSSFVVLFIAFFGLATVLYSIGYFRKEGANPRYYSFVLWTLGGAIGAVLSNNLIMLLIFWEIVTVLLFFLVNLGKNKENLAAAKSFAVLGITDAGMTFAVILIGILYNSVTISELSIKVDGFLPGLAYVLLFIGATAKAGAMPFHSWIPTVSESAATPVMAFLPASLDKLLGIYLLARISLNMFELTSVIYTIMLIVGAFTVLLSVLMALVQHDIRKLLSFHAISQVGYMVLGIGTGTVVGTVGGIFHMLNHSIYKSLLFFNAGAIEKQTGETDLSKIGGLARFMPITFVTTVIAAFSISGIPPLNGFFSKWMIYRGIVESKGIIFLAVAMFGSALTLASFIKVLHSTFLGAPTEVTKKAKEAPLSMITPMVVLALLCVLFGVFASYPLNNFILPALDKSAFGTIDTEAVIGASSWTPDLAAVLMLVGLVVGMIFFYLTKLTKVRTTKVYIGGEVPDTSEMRYSGVDFYKTIRELKIMGAAYSDAEKGWFDPYFVVAKIGNSAIMGMKKLHNGVLSTYLSWCLIGLAVLLIFLLLV